MALFCFSHKAVRNQSQGQLSLSGHITALHKMTSDWGRSSGRTALHPLPISEELLGKYVEGDINKSLQNYPFWGEGRDKPASANGQRRHFWRWNSLQVWGKAPLLRLRNPLLPLSCRRAARTETTLEMSRFAFSMFRGQWVQKLGASRMRKWNNLYKYIEKNTQLITN